MSNELNQPGTWYQHKGFLYILRKEAEVDYALVNDLTIQVYAQPRDEARETALATELHQYLQHRAAAHATGEAGEAFLRYLYEWLEDEAAKELPAEDAHDWRANDMNGQFDDTFDAAEAHGRGTLASTIRAAISAELLNRTALTPAPAQAPQPAAPRCGGGGVGVSADAIDDLMFWGKLNTRGKEGSYLHAEPQASVTDLLEILAKHGFTTPPTCPGTCRTCPAAGDAGEAEGAREGGVEA